MYLPCNNPERFSTISSTDVARWRADLSISRIQFGSNVCAAMVVSRLFGLLALVKFFAKKNIVTKSHVLGPWLLLDV